MKKLFLSLLLLFAGFVPLWSSSSAAQEDELVQIIKELKSLNDEQLLIIQRSQSRNEELERLSKQQETQIENLTELSQNRQKTIDSQKQTIDELQNYSKEQKKSSIKTTINSILAAVASFLIGCAVGVLFL